MSLQLLKGMSDMSVQDYIVFSSTALLYVFSPNFIIQHVFSYHLLGYSQWDWLLLLFNDTMKWLTNVTNHYFLSSLFPSCFLDEEEGKSTFIS